MHAQRMHGATAAVDTTLARRQAVRSVRRSRRCRLRPHGTDPTCGSAPVSSTRTSGRSTTATGDVLNRYWGHLDKEFAGHQFVLYDDERDELLAEGHTIPFRWDGSAEGLPAGIDGLIIDAFALREQGGEANT